jgi:xylulose-5-phosphate/fructose-6-phosphate phosphoketolase
MDAAIKHCSQGIGVWDWASNDQGGAPDVVMGCCGDVPTLETLAAVDLLRREQPDIKIRVVNVVDLMTLQSKSQHPHGLEDSEFDALFTRDRPVIFAYHGYPTLIHRLTYKRTNHDNFHVHGFEEEGTTTTPFDMVVRNHLDRFHLVDSVLDYVPRADAVYLRQKVRDWLVEHEAYIRQRGTDMPMVRDWTWPA